MLLSWKKPCGLEYKNRNHVFKNRILDLISIRRAAILLCVQYAHKNVFSCVAGRVGIGISRGEKTFRLGTHYSSFHTYIYESKAIVDQLLRETQSFVDHM